MTANEGEQQGDTVEASLAALYSGVLAEAKPPRFSISPPPDALPAVDLFIPGTLEEVLARFGDRYTAGDIRGVASQWSKWYFTAILVPALIAILVLRRELPLALDRLYVLMSLDDRVDRLYLQDTGRPLSQGSDEKVFSRLLDDHLRPIVDTLAGVSGASPRVFWSNAGNTFEQCLNQIEQHPTAWPDMTDDARHFLTQPRLKDERRNPFYLPVRYRERPDGSTKRVRRLCCIRYLVPELSYCGNCPLKK
ncbi:siderophore-iron reductase FhuF [Halomonas sp. GXIMD04776]|uniref:siderophore-iron reductase FhuF n=1 Tax=Halomonas sp. GXIMD04776 TaxID=3415605 RepID=UPI003CC04CE6